MHIIPVANEHDMIASLVYLDPFVSQLTSLTWQVNVWRATPIELRRSIVSAGELVNGHMRYELTK